MVRIQNFEDLLTKVIPQAEIDQFMDTLEKIKANLSASHAPCEGPCGPQGAEVVRR